MRGWVQGCRDYGYDYGCDYGYGYDYGHLGTSFDAYGACMHLPWPNYSMQANLQAWVMHCICCFHANILCMGSWLMRGTCTMLLVKILPQARVSKLGLAAISWECLRLRDYGHHAGLR